MLWLELVEPSCFVGDFGEVVEEIEEEEREEVDDEDVLSLKGSFSEREKNRNSFIPGTGRNKILTI